MKIIIRDRNILKLTIKRKIGNRFKRVIINDSLAILPGQLRQLGKDFEVEVQKTYFPYNFCRRDTVFYKVLHQI